MTKSKNTKCKVPALKDKLEEFLRQAGTSLYRNCRNGEKSWMNQGCNKRKQYWRVVKNGNCWTKNTSPGLKQKQ